MEYGILLHDPDDDVGVTVFDLKPGQEIGTATLEGEPVGTVKIIQEIPLSHKVAVKKIEPDGKVIEYGRPIGKATQNISPGEHVHVHNLRTIRW